MSAAALAHPGPRHRRPRLTLYRYVAREALRPTIFALLGLTLVVLTTRVLEFSELVINRGVEAGSVAAILFYEAVPVAGRMLPFSVLVGALFALGRMGADREILALEASGIAPARLTWPVVSFASVAAVAALAMGAFATPWSSARLDATLLAISREKPWANLRPGVVQRYGGWQLEAREVGPSGDRLGGVMLWTPEIGQTIFAAHGRLSAADGDLGIALDDGAAVLARDGGAQFLRFDVLETRLPGGRILEREPPDRILGLPLDELAAQALAFVPSPGNRLSPAALELQRRFAYPMATLVFGFLAVPLFLTRAHASRSAGGVMGLLCTLAYYGLVQLSEGLVQGGTLGPGLGAWLPNLILAALALVLLVRALRERALGRPFERPLSSRLRRRAAQAGRRARAADREPRLHRHALPRYVAGRFLQLSVLTFSALFTAYLLIDVMDRLEWFARHGATGIEALRFYAARAPLLASRAVPMAILVATSLCVSLLAAEGELLGMRACGIPAPRALLPLFLLSTAVAPLYFAFNNTVLPRTNALADELKRTEIKGGQLRLSQRAGVWHRSGTTMLQAARFDPEQGVGLDVTVYRLGADGLPVERTDADSMHHIGRGMWRLVAPMRIEIADGVARRVEPPRYLELGESIEAEADTMHMSVAEIAREAEAAEQAGIDATTLRVDYHAKLAEPLACIVLPAAVLFFAVTGPPFPGPAQTLLVSGIIGVVYILLAGVATSLGHGGQVPPAVGGFGPIAVFALLALVFARRMWRRM
jgi:LPS export ABC transporter permease LptG/LPS export ABC transporter permease LptF